MIRELNVRYCPEEDSNLHTLRRWYLKRASPPIPPLRLPHKHSASSMRCMKRMANSAASGMPVKMTTIDGDHCPDN